MKRANRHHMVPNNHLHRLFLSHAACFIVLIILLRIDLVDGFSGITTVTGKNRSTHHHHDKVLYNNEPSCLQGEIQQLQDGENNSPQASASSPSTILIHWKGEGTEGSTLQFRHVEFQGALQAVLLANSNNDAACKYNVNDYTISFSNALEYSGEAEMPPHKRIRFNSAMQYLHLEEYHAADDDNEQRMAPMTTMTKSRSFPLEFLIQAAERCSLIHAMYQVVATVPSHESYDQLSERALELGLLNGMSRGNVEEHATWCVRVRYYGGGDNVGNHQSNSSNDENNNTFDSGREKRRKREKRHGERTRSLSRERRALQALKPLLLTFGGGVDLQNPDCQLFIMDGLLKQPQQQPSLILHDDEGRKNHRDDDDEQQQHQQQQQQQVKILARRIAIGPRVSIMAPATRICITNTPLCPMAAFWMCNIAGIRPGQSILDPFAGSCSILMAAAMIHASCRTVGIEIAHNGLVDRHDIRRDFVTRNLTLPRDLVHGDCTDVRVRRRAKRALLLRHDDDDHHGKQHQHDDDDHDHDDNDVSTLPSFDYIITDPPYGIRESTNYNSKTPLQELFQAIANDRQAAHETPLLKPGGKLVCFVPIHDGEDLFGNNVLPSQAEQDRAGLVLQKEIMQEQPLNENLSRWLLCFHSV